MLPKLPLEASTKIQGQATQQRVPPSAALPPVTLLRNHLPTTQTYRALAFFSEKTLKQKSPSLKGSKVDGTTRYCPGGSWILLDTSRRFV